MEDNTREKIWDYLVAKVKENRDPQAFLGDLDLQKKQYLFWRKEIISFFNAQLNAGEVKGDEDIERNIHTPQFTYFKDMSDMGIDPRAVFRQHLIDDNTESDYQSWLKGGYAFTKNSHDIIGAVR